MHARVLTAVLDGALRDRLTTEFLHRRIVELRSRGRYGIPKLRAVIEGVEATRGGHSWFERRYLELIATAGLPRPDTQAIVAKRDDRLIRVDCRFQAHGSSSSCSATGTTGPNCRCCTTQNASIACSSTDSWWCSSRTAKWCRNPSGSSPTHWRRWHRLSETGLWRTTEARVSVVCIRCHSCAPATVASPRSNGR